MGKTDIYKILMQNILQYGEIGLHVIDNNRKTIIYNKIMADLEGLGVNQVFGKDILEIFPSLNENTSTLIKVLYTFEPILNSTQTYLNYKGKEITTINSTIPLLDDGKIIGALEIANNMTHVRNLSEKLIDLQKELKSTKTNNKSINKIKRYNFDDIIGEDKNIKLAKTIAKKACSSSSSVLIYGDTGTGKELFAQSIHYRGIRSKKHFIAQNCAAIPEALLEGILFGTDKGGFTGAVEREGIFEQADGGTLMLDEINSMSLSLQAKLLRVLQEGYIRRIGGIKDIPVDVRIIATTNKPKISLGELAHLMVVDTTKIGSFLDWGLEKDLFLPFSETVGSVEKGKEYLVGVYIDKSDRLCATMRIKDMLRTDSDYRENNITEGTIYSINRDIGAFVAVDDKYDGLIPKRELLGAYEVGDKLEVRINKVLEDGKLDLSLRDRSYIQMDTDGKTILKKLKESGGSLPLGDKSPPDLIRKELKMSKSGFKRAIGRLYKEGIITISDNGIKLKK